MTWDKFQVVGDQLVGRGLSFDVATFVASEQKIDPAECGKHLAEIAEVAYRGGRSSLLLSWNERFDLHAAVEILRAVAVIAGPLGGDRHRRAADILARLLHNQEEGA